jgi:hypothetical protein
MPQNNKMILCYLGFIEEDIIPYSGVFVIFLESVVESIKN